MQQTLDNQEQAELAAWRAGPWVLQRDHDKMVALLRDQLTKALAALAEIHAKNIKEGRAA